MRIGSPRVKRPRHGSWLLIGAPSRSCLLEPPPERDREHLELPLDVVPTPRPGGDPLARDATKDSAAQARELLRGRPRRPVEQVRLAARALGAGRGTSARASDPRC